VKKVGEVRPWAGRGCIFFSRRVTWKQVGENMGIPGWGLTGRVQGHKRREWGQIGNGRQAGGELALGALRPAEVRVMGWGVGQST
jgi:hypothetical protein